MKECMERIIAELENPNLSCVRYDHILKKNVDDKQRLIDFIKREFELTNERLNIDDYDDYDVVYATREIFEAPEEKSLETSYVLKKCVYCKEIKQCKYTYDPYLADVANKKVYGYWCDDCRHERAQDV